MRRPSVHSASGERRERAWMRAAASGMERSGRGDVPDIAERILVLERLR